jgi:hypothetical protein
MKGARALPKVLKSRSMMIWTTATDQNQTQEDQSENNHNFDTWEPELEFAEESDTEIVDDNYYHEKDCNKSSRVDSCAGGLVLNKQWGRGEIVGRDDDVLTR